MKRAAVSVIIGAIMLSAASPAIAKGESEVRGYAVLTGPGLGRPIVFSAPWDPAKGGYYGEDAEIFLALADYSGAIPAGTDTSDGSAQGVLPVPQQLQRSGLGAQYRLTWLRDDHSEVVRQNIYPFGAGLPVVYTIPSSRAGLLKLFGRFQYPPDVWTGWGKATDDSLLVILRSRGLPTSDPTTRSEPEPGTTGPAFTPTTPSGYSPWMLPLIALALIIGVAAGRASNGKRHRLAS